MRRYLHQVVGLACLAAAFYAPAHAGPAEAGPFMVRATRAPDQPWSEFPTRILGSLPGYVPRQNGALSQYGGQLDGPRYRATGFFRAEKAGERWWLVDPEGFRYVNMAVVSVSIQKSSTAIKAALDREFGSHAAWARAALDQLHAYGFNGSGGWSDDAALRASPHPVAYTRIWNFMSAYGKKRGGTYQMSGHIGYPNGCMFVFDPDFAIFCLEYAAENLPALKDDPWLLGHYSDNELPFYRESLDNFLGLPASDPGFKAAQVWWSGRRASGAATAEITDDDRHAFLGYMAETYLSITSAAIRRYDPNHMCLGPRLNAYELDVEPVFVAAGRHLDVIAINYYRRWTPEPERMHRWNTWSGKPFLVTEWYAKGMDSGFTNMSGAGWTVETQQDRGHFYQNFTLGLLESGGCVGWHWFKYMDNDPADLSTDPSNRDSNKGIVTTTFTPYVPLLAAMRDLNTQAYSLIDYFDSRPR